MWASDRSPFDRDGPRADNDGFLPVSFLPELEKLNFNIGTQGQLTGLNPIHGRITGERIDIELEYHVFRPNISHILYTIYIEQDAA